MVIKKRNLLIRILKCTKITTFLQNKEKSCFEKSIDNLDTYSIFKTLRALYVC